MQMTLRTALFTATVIGCLFALGSGIDSHADERPNLLIILADDMGYGDAGCLGSKVLKTPNLDSLAESGVLCTQGYVASAVCSPSRAGLITGRDPRRFGYQANLNQSPPNYTGRPELLGLPSNEHTIADHVKAAGYATGLVGKWHLGIGAGFHPNERGFDSFCGMLQGGHHYFPATVQHTIERNGQPVKRFSSPYLTDFFTDECVDFIRRRHGVDDRQPWFLYASYNAPHTPMHATEEDLARFASIADPKRRTYAAMMYALDRGIGRIRACLQETGEWENTLCVFLSDNGGATNNGSWNGALRGVKGSLREGGIRVPMIWNWPAGIQGGRVCDAAMSSLDILPTFLAAIDVEPLPLAPPLSHQDKRNRKRMAEAYGAYDGVNLLPQLTQPEAEVSRRLFWRLQGQSAVLDGDEKVVRLSHRPAEMFRVSDDVAETNDLSSTEAGRMTELLQELGRWEFLLPTMPAWGSSPYWNGQSAKHYDNWLVRPEPGQ